MVDETVVCKTGTDTDTGTGTGTVIAEVEAMLGVQFKPGVTWPVAGQIHPGEIVWPPGLLEAGVVAGDRTLAGLDRVYPEMGGGGRWPVKDRIHPRSRVHGVRMIAMALDPVLVERMASRVVAGALMGRADGSGCWYWLRETPPKDATEGYQNPPALQQDRKRGTGLVTFPISSLLLVRAALAAGERRAQVLVPYRDVIGRHLIKRGCEIGGQECVRPGEGHVHWGIDKRSPLADPALTALTMEGAVLDPGRTVVCSRGHQRLRGKPCMDCARMNNEESKQLMADVCELLRCSQGRFRARSKAPGLGRGYGSRVEAREILDRWAREDAAGIPEDEMEWLEDLRQEMREMSASASASASASVSAGIVRSPRVW